ncbi:breast carcinoma-amplified sequence 1 isoform X8 [Archocentrus centrarchus]|uniref:breast carcinoma-amplified sequence 1 isoform X8 n=1 Tax=Archocentrus centrarchus TaxID=63155 RepID=UPI0011EA131B|nr:breast carcinoma-amplified sequence 1 isoform X8 [Archocentrus centrarchus]
MGNEQSISKEQLDQNGTIPEKHENGTVNGISVEITPGGLEIGGKSETTVCQNGEVHSLNLAIEPTATVEAECQPDGSETVSETPDTNVQKEEIKKSKGEKGRRNFGKLFKKKKGEVENAEEKGKETPSEDQTDDPANLKQEPESLTEPESVTPVSRPEEAKVPETDNGNSEPVESQEKGNPEENSVMNFFKTLVAPTKTSKKETATPDAAKDQPQKETQPAATTTIAQISEPPAAPKGMSVPPPPPPEPPKMEIKGEPTAKPVKPSAKEEPKAAAKEPQSSKGKSAKDTLSKLFRQKKVDSSKAGTLEAAAKPEPPPPAQEEKKTASKSSFLSLFKPQVLLDHMTTKVQAASTSGVRLLRKTTGLAAEPKKATPTPPVATEAAQAVKTKEEPKVASKTSEQAADNKPASAASQAGDDAASMPKKLEKRNSIQLFFKNLTQKRHSTDAGVQTEPLTAAPGAEKAK